MPAWRVYYADGSTISSDDMAAEETPAWGVVAVVTRDPEGQVTSVHGPKFDYFWYDGAEWWGSDLTGLLDALARRAAQVVCMGRVLSNEDFSAIIARSVKDRLDG